MRHLLTKNEIHCLIDAIPTEDAIWIPNDKERKAQYRKIVISGDHLELIKMIKAIHVHKKECKEKIPGYTYLTKIFAKRQRNSCAVNFSMF